jgi:hypothetical protein
MIDQFSVAKSEIVPCDMRLHSIQLIAHGEEPVPGNSGDGQSVCSQGTVCMPDRRNFMSSHPMPSGEAWMSVVVSCVFRAAADLWEAEKGHLRVVVEQRSGAEDWATSPNILADDF